MQMLLENRNLRARLDQMETQSSWHSGNTRDTVHGVEYSPVSFAPISSGIVGVQSVDPMRIRSALEGVPKDSSNFESIGMTRLEGQVRSQEFTPEGFGPVGSRAGVPNAGCDLTGHQDVQARNQSGGMCPVASRLASTRIVGFDSQGYPVSPGGTTIRPPAKREVRRGLRKSKWDPLRIGLRSRQNMAADIGTSAVACGNWMAQVRQIFVGLSPSASQWWMSVEKAAGVGISSG